MTDLNKQITLLPAQYKQLQTWQASNPNKKWLIVDIDELKQSILSLPEITNESSQLVALSFLETSGLVPKTAWFGTKRKLCRIVNQTAVFTGYETPEGTRYRIEHSLNPKEFLSSWPDLIWDLSGSVLFQHPLKISADQWSVSVLIAERSVTVTGGSSTLRFVEIPGTDPIIEITEQGCHFRFPNTVLPIACFPFNGMAFKIVVHGLTEEQVLFNTIALKLEYSVVTLGINSRDQLTMRQVIWKQGSDFYATDPSGNYLKLPTETLEDLNEEETQLLQDSDLQFVGMSQVQ